MSDRGRLLSVLFNWYPGNDLPLVGSASSSYPRAASPPWSSFSQVPSHWCAVLCSFNPLASNVTILKRTSPHNKWEWPVDPNAVKISLIRLVIGVSVRESEESEESKFLVIAILWWSRAYNWQCAARRSAILQGDKDRIKQVYLRTTNLVTTICSRLGVLLAIWVMYGLSTQLQRKTWHI